LKAETAGGSATKKKKKLMSKCKTNHLEWMSEIEICKSQTNQILASKTDEGSIVEQAFKF
jgi:hypothetical protein